MNKLTRLVLVMFILCLYGCGDTNFLSWVHKRGADDSISSLKADAQVALIDKDYAKAFEYYTKIIEKNPKDSVARYGRAQAAYGKANISLAKILSSAITTLKENESSFSPPAADQSLICIYDIAKRDPASPEDLIPIEDLKALYDANKTAIPDLKVIADGQSDGVIPYDDPDVNINLAIMQALQAALFILDSNADEYPNGPGDIVNINNDYEITDNVQGLNANEKEVLKEQVRKAMIYIKGAREVINTIDRLPFGYTIDWRGSIDYLDTAISSNDLAMEGILSDLRDTFNDMYDRPYDTNDLKGLWDKLQ